MMHYDAVLSKDVKGMTNFLSLKEMMRHYFASRRNRYLTIGCLMGLSLFSLVKGCSSSESEKKEYYIGQDNRWPTLNVMGRERLFATFTHNLLATIAKPETFGFHLVEAPSADLIPQLEQGKLQGVLISLEPDALNTRKLAFSDPYFLTGPVLVIPATAPLKGWNEQRKKIVGVEAKSHFLLRLEQDPSIQLKIYNDSLKALSDLERGRIDGAVLPIIPAYTYVETFYKDKLQIVTLPLTTEGARLVALKDSEGQLLIQRFNEGLAVLKQNGVYKKLLGQWGLIDPEEIVVPQPPL